jgi:SNF2 family DNA or RNA helicase
LANDCGTGKTVEILGLVYLSSIRQETDNMGKAEPTPYRPTLVICPPALFNVWYADCAKFFANIINLRHYYGNEANTSTSQKESVIGAGIRDLEKVLNELDTADPQSARTIILTTYPTWSNRTLKVVEATNTKASSRSSTIDDDEDDEELFGDDEDDEDDDKAVKARVERMYASHFKQSFARVVCDEAHFLKNHRTRSHVAIDALQAEKLWLVTATPMMNTVGDLFGYLRLLWRPEWAEWTIVVDRLKLDAYKDDFDYLKAVKERYPTIEKESLRRLSTTVNRHGVRPWALEPSNFKTLAMASAPMSAESAQIVLPAILKQIQLRRTMASFIDLENGLDPIRIGAEIPPYEVVTVELQMNATQARMYDAAYNRHRPLGNAMDFLQDALLADNESTKRKKKGKATVAQRAPFIAHRRLMHMGTSIHLEKLVEKIKAKRAMVKNVTQWHDKDGDHGLSFLFKATSEPWYPPYALREQLADFVASLSPKIQYLCRLISEVCLVEGRRLQILVDMPMSQW